MERLHYSQEEINYDYIFGDLLGDKVKGNEFAAVELSRPRVYLEEIVKYGAAFCGKEVEIISV